MPQFVLRFIGVYHDDLECRNAFLAQMRESKTEHGDPKFVAVEANDNLVDEVRLQREALSKSMRSAWSSAHGPLADDLAKTFAYEADSHNDIFPSVRTIWLDRGRLTLSDPSADGRMATSRPVFECVRTAAAAMLQVCMSCIDGTSTYIDLDREKIARAFASRRSATETVPGKLEVHEHWSDGRCTPRDLVWAERIREATAGKTGASDWGLVVVGVRHTDADASTVLGLLKDEVEMEVKVCP